MVAGELLLCGQSNLGLGHFGLLNMLKYHQKTEMKAHAYIELKIYMCILDFFPRFNE